MRCYWQRQQPVALTRIVWCFLLVVKRRISSWQLNDGCDIYTNSASIGNSGHSVTSRRWVFCREHVFLLSIEVRRTALTRKMSECQNRTRTCEFTLAKCIFDLSWPWSWLSICGELREWPGHRRWTYIGQRSIDRVATNGRTDTTDCSTYPPC